MSGAPKTGTPMVSVFPAARDRREILLMQPLQPQGRRNVTAGALTLGTWSTHGWQRPYSSPDAFFLIWGENGNYVLLSPPPSSHIAENSLI